MDEIRIKRTIEERLKLPFGVININTRKREIVYARQLAHSIMCEIQEQKQIDHYKIKYTNHKEEHWYLSLETIGKIFGNKEHSTVLHSCKQIKNLCENNKIVRSDFIFLLDKITKEYDLSFDVEITQEDRFSSIIASLVNLLKKKLSDKKANTDTFLDYLLDIYSQRDDYSSAKILELVKDKHLKLNQ